MKLFLIAIGGTGAKTCEALVHLLAAGVVSQDEIPEVHLFLVDSDKEGQLVTNAVDAIRAYRSVRGDVLNGQPERSFFGPSLAFDAVWSPTAAGTQQTADLIFGATRDPGARALYEALVPARWRREGFDVGFLGNASLGSAVMAAARLEDNKAWQQLESTMRQAAQAKAGAAVVLIGSAIGGTGASGIPTFAALTKKRISPPLPTAAVLALQYFGFASPSGSEPGPRAEDFAQKSREAVDYYRRVKLEQDLSAIYLVGEPENCRPSYAYAPGGAEQANPPHFDEVVMALCAIDFSLQKKSGAGIPARPESSNIGLKNLPWPSGGEALLRYQLFAQTCYALATSVAPAFKRVGGEVGRTTSLAQAERVPWYLHFFGSRQEPKLRRQDAATMDLLNSYCEDFLAWVRDMHDPQAPELISPGNVEVNLVPGWRALRGPLHDREPADLEALFGSRRRGRMVEKAWSRLCDKRPEKSHGAETLFRSLLEAVEG